MERSSPFDCIQMVRFYFDKILSFVKESKKYFTLLLDDKTTEIISVIYNMKDLTEKNIISVLNIKNKIDKKCEFDAIVFMSPSDASVKSLIYEISDPNFVGYYLYLSSEISERKLEKLAMNDISNIIKNVVEFNCEYVALNSSLFSLNLRYNPKLCSFAEYNDNIILGIKSFLLSGRIKPDICFSTTYDSTRILAESLSTIISKDNTFQFASNKDSYLLLLVDRREDAITPLLTKWTYQSIIHELFDFSNNICDLNIKTEKKSYTLSELDDNFYALHKYSDYGVLCDSIKMCVKEFSKEKESSTKSSGSIEQMKTIIQMIPEMTKKNEIISKHMNIIPEISNIIEKRHLLKLSELEQKLIKDDNLMDSMKIMSDFISDTSNNYDNYDMLKLVLIFALHHKSNKYLNIKTLKNMLINRGTFARPTVLAGSSRDCISENDIKIIDFMLEHCCSGTKKLDFFSKLMHVNVHSIMESTNILTHHKSLIYNVLKQLAKNKLNKLNYVTHKLHPVIQYSKVIVFMIGGCTYEEVVEIQSLQSKLPFQVVIGGTSVVNSKQFIDDIKNFM
jgi:vacuolar protein sorting-associated protein 45